MPRLERGGHDATWPPAPAPTRSMRLEGCIWPGPFKGAPLSVAVITPALAGPYDYGTVVVRVALHVDPLTAQVPRLSDSVPKIIGGVPIRMRSIQVHIDRPEFHDQPDQLRSDLSRLARDRRPGLVTNFSSYFNAVNCATLPFRPKLRSGRGGPSRRREKEPGARARSQHPAGRCEHQIPFGDPADRLRDRPAPPRQHLFGRRAPRDDCAGRTPIGKSSTKTPLLDQPLTGNVYAVSGSGGLPRLAFILNGQVKLVPRANTKSAKGGRLKTTVPVVPDAPIGHFHLRLRRREGLPHQHPQPLWPRPRGPRRLQRSEREEPARWRPGCYDRLPGTQEVILAHFLRSWPSHPTNRAGHRRLRAEPRRDWARR